MPLSPEEHLAGLGLTELEIARRMEEAYAALVVLIRAGTPAREAVAATLQTFEGQYYALLAVRFAERMDRAIGVIEIKDWPVGEVKLSDRLHAAARETSAVVARLVNQHRQGWNDAKTLGKAIYEGYGFKKDVTHVAPAQSVPKYLRAAFGDDQAFADLMAHDFTGHTLRQLANDPTIGPQLAREYAKIKAANLKTPAMKAAYLQALDALEQGAGMKKLEKQLRIVHYEKNRYLANRIAQTELHREWAKQQAGEIMDDAYLDVVQIVMSQAHPAADICDLFARVDKYGLGAGCYPKAQAPRPPFHPHCRCTARKRYDLNAAGRVTAQPDAEREWLRAQGDDANQIVGSRDKLAAVMKGADPVEVYNGNTDPLYRVGRVGDVATMPAMNDSYQIAKGGGKHSGMLKNYSSLTASMVERGIKSMERQISMHEAWISSPFSKLPTTMDSREVNHLVNVKWPRDIARLREEADVLRGLIKERGNEQ